MIQHTLVGSKCLAKYGYSRETYDSDFLYQAKDLKEVLKIWADEGFRLEKHHWSHFTARRGSKVVDLLFVADSAYLEIMQTAIEVQGNDLYSSDNSLPKMSKRTLSQSKFTYASLEGLISMYIQSSKPLNFHDLVILLRTHPDAKPLPELGAMYSDVFEEALRQSRLPEKEFKGYSEEPIDLEEILKLLEESQLN